MYVDVGMIQTVIHKLIHVTATLIDVRRVKFDALEHMCVHLRYHSDATLIGFDSTS